MKLIESIHKVLQIILLLSLILIAGSLILRPDKFGKHTASIFKTLESHGIELKLGPSGPTVSYTPAEAKEALTEQLTIDSIASKATCLGDQSCTPEDQQKLSLALGIKAEQAPPTEEESPYIDKWIVIFGADRSIEAARHEIRKADPLGYELKLILVDGWYRSIAIFSSRASAQAALPHFQVSLAKPDAYIRLLTRWCSTPQPSALHADVIDCKANW